MTNLTTEEMQRIVDGAPEGATHFQHGYGLYYICGTALPMAQAWINGNWEQYVIYPNMSALSDLRTILAQQQEIERLREQQDSKAITMLFGLMGYLTSMEEPITFSRYHNATTGSDILRRLMEANELKGNCDWDSYKSPKETKDHE